MSGPKYTDYELEYRQLLVIKAKLEAEIERGKCEELKQALKKCEDKLKKQAAQIDIGHCEQLLKTAKQVIPSNRLISEISKLLNDVKSIKSVTYNDKGSSSVLSDTLNRCKKQFDRIKNISIQIDNLLKELNAEYNEQRQENLANEFENMKWEAPLKISSVSERLMEVYNDIVEHLMGYNDFEIEKSKYDAIMTNHTFDDNYKISKMKTMFESFLVEKQMSTNNIEVIELRSEYITLHNLLYGQCEIIPEDVSILKKEIEKMKETAQQHEVGEYVSECVGEVMNSLGYDVIGGEVLETQKINKQHYDFTENSIITVASSDGGSMMLEVVGKTSNDGTTASKAEIKNDMEQFCPDFEKIQKGLLQYGIKLRIKKLCPPDEKYVRYSDIERTSDRRITSKSRKRMMYNE